MVVGGADWDRAGGLGVAFEGSETAAEIGPLAELVEARGGDTIWLANHLFQRDPVVQSMAALAATGRVKAALMAISPYATHPVQAAMAAASLDEHFPGRVVLSLGAGAPGDFDAAGIARPQPLKTLAESLAVIRALLAGETVRHEGEVYRVQDRALETGARPVPLVLAASGPGMLRLAGEAADGVLLSAATSLSFVEASLARVEAGAKGRRIRRIGLVYCSVDADRGRAYDRMRPRLAFVLRGPHHKTNLEMSRVRLDQAALWDAVAAGDWDRASGLISDEVVAEHSASGTASEVAERLAAYRAAGLDEVVIAGLRDGDQLAQVLAAAADL